MEEEKKEKKNPYLRDLRGDDPDEHDCDNQAQPRPVLETGAHARRQLFYD